MKFGAFFQESGMTGNLAQIAGNQPSALLTMAF